ncbi:hypothetical protein ANT2_1198 [plant metagenome]|uniref:Uncharacterized protein n=1 Tax=plant metagenome TaxID=1297885 RepID=A0A484RC14_9ZZZZ
MLPVLVKQYRPPRGPVQYVFWLQAQPWVSTLSGRARSACAGLAEEPPNTAGQDFLLPLAEPSLQTKVSPSQCEMPPLLPEQGVFAADAAPGMASKAAINSRRARSMKTHGKFEFTFYI